MTVYQMHLNKNFLNWIQLIDLNQEYGKAGSNPLMPSKFIVDEYKITRVKVSRLFQPFWVKSRICTWKGCGIFNSQAGPEMAVFSWRYLEH